VSESSITLEQFADQLFKAAKTTLSQIGEDLVSRHRDLVPIHLGHLRRSITKRGPLVSGDDLYIRVGCAATAQKSVGPKSKRSEAETEDIQPRGRTGSGGAFANYALIVHEQMAWSAGPPGFEKGVFKMGRSAGDSGGKTLDEPQGGHESTDGDRGGQFMARPRANTPANQRRFRIIIEANMAAHKVVMR
jgi:hypothetical protein